MKLTPRSNRPNGTVDQTVGRKRTGAKTMETTSANAQLTRRTFFKLSAVTAFGATIVGLAGCSSSSSDASGSSSGGTLTMLNYADWMGKDEVANVAKQ